jgi:hypothetical protein
MAEKAGVAGRQAVEPVTESAKGQRPSGRSDRAPSLPPEKPLEKSKGFFILLLAFTLRGDKIGVEKYE